MQATKIIERINDLFRDHRRAVIDVSGEDDEYLIAIITIPGEAIISLSGETRQNRPKRPTVFNLHIRMQQAEARSGATLLEWGKKVADICSYGETITRIAKMHADCHEPVVVFRITSAQVVDPQGDWA